MRDHYAHGLEEIPTIRITYGQCQKWVNMLMKYGWVSGGADWGWCECWFRVAHAPVDQVILKAALTEKAVFQAPCKSWAKWDNYDEYLQFQEQIRTVAAKTATTPLELEFEWWEKYSKLSLVQSSRES